MSFNKNSSRKRHSSPSRFQQWRRYPPPPINGGTAPSPVGGHDGPPDIPIPTEPQPQKSREEYPEGAHLEEYP